MMLLRCVCPFHRHCVKPLFTTPNSLELLDMLSGQFRYRGGKIFKRFFFRLTKIKGVKNWYCSLEMKEKFGMRPLAATS